MPDLPLDETDRRILEYLCRAQSFERIPPVFASRGDISGMLRLSLNEYDEACGRLAARRLIRSDQPGSGDLDFIAPTRAGRRTVTRPPQPGSPGWRILEHLCRAPGVDPAGSSGERVAREAGPALALPGGTPASQPVAPPASTQQETGGFSAPQVMQAAGIPTTDAYQAACELLYAWGLIERQAEGASHYARIAPTQAGRETLAG